MRYCYNCNRITTGEPLYCNYCGRSFDLKLCPHRHANPRSAEVCSQCGSRDLSTPQPRLPFWLIPLLWFLSILPGALLLVLTIGFLLAAIYAILTDPQLMGRLVVLAMLLGLLWMLYMRFPPFVRQALRRVWRWRSGRGDRHER